MSQSTEKKMRRERKKAIQQFLLENKDIVLNEVIITLRRSKLREKIAFCIMLFVRGKR